MRSAVIWGLLLACVLNAPTAYSGPPGSELAERLILGTAEPQVRVDCSRPGTCGSVEKESYAYAAADIRRYGVRHLYFCSGGITNLSFDAIRYINDRDRQLKVALSVPSGAKAGTDMAACDPSVVSFGDYIYMAYGSSIAVNRQAQPRGAWVFINAIHLARSRNLASGFQVLNADNEWKEESAVPQAIAQPSQISTQLNHRTGYLGASWPSLVVHGGKMRLWYFDDTGGQGRPGAKLQRYLYSESLDGIVWSQPKATTISDVVHSGEVKYDPVTGRFFMFAVFNPHEAGSWLGVLTSSDGLNWGPVERLGRLPAYSHNVGLQSDEHGYLLPGPIEFTYGAPIGLVSALSQGRWSLYAGTVVRR